MPSDRERLLEEARRIRESCLSEDCVDVEPVIADALLGAEARVWDEVSGGTTRTFPGGYSTIHPSPRSKKWAERAAELREAEDHPGPREYQ